MLSVKPYRQKTGLCCVASLKMVLEYFGMDVSEGKLIKLTGATVQKGISAEGVKSAAESLGFEVEIKDNAGFEDIKFWLDKKIPPIVDWFSIYNDYSEGHCSIVVGLGKNYIYLQDPEIAGIRKMKRIDFVRVWFDFEGDFIKDKNDLILRRLVVIKKRRLC
jgi:ABC-type bacteriocin/lantibiotic exporter with double-glycine peptidase domain